MNIWHLNAFENKKNIGYSMDIWEAWFWDPSHVEVGDSPSNTPLPSR